MNASLPAAHPTVTNPAVPSLESSSAEGDPALPGAAYDVLSAANGHSAGLSAWLGPNGAQWAAKAAEFNRYPTRYAHPSWIPEGWAPWVPRFAGRGRAEAELGLRLLGAWGLDGRPCFDFAPPVRRFALLDAAPLRRTVLLAGLARHAGEISRLMERGRVLELKEQVGEAGYRFVRLRAPLLAGPLAEGANTAAEGTDWLTRSWAAGLGMLGACLGAEHAGLLARVSVKFPRDCAPFLGAGGGQGSVDGYMRLFRRVLVKEGDPAWDALFS